MQGGTKYHIVKVCLSTHTSALSGKYFAQSAPNLKLLQVSDIVIPAKAGIYQLIAISKMSYAIPDE